jgi:hypothetical protein
MSDMICTNTVVECHQGLFKCEGVFKDGVETRQTSYDRVIRGVCYLSLDTHNRGMPFEFCGGYHERKSFLCVVYSANGAE